MLNVTQIYDFQHKRREFTYVSWFPLRPLRKFHVCCVSGRNETETQFRDRQ